MSHPGGAALDARAGNADAVESSPGVLTPARTDRKSGYSRAELVKDLRCSRARELGLDGTAAHVREKLMVFANADRETFVSVTTLAAAIGRSEKTIRRALSRLYAAGEVVPRIEVTAWGRRNVYRLAGLGVAHADDETAAAERGAETGTTRPSCARGQNDPMGTVTVTRPPPSETLLSDRDQKNVPPPPPLVVAPEVPTVVERVIARWRDAKLPALDEHRARVAIGRRVAEGAGAEELLDAVEGARARNGSEGWTGVSSAFAVVMASADDVRAYAKRSRDARAARERAQAEERQARARDRANELLAISTRGSLAKTIAAAAAGRFELAARLAQEVGTNPEDPTAPARADNSAISLQTCGPENKCIVSAMASKRGSNQGGKAHRFGGDWTTAKLDVLAKYLTSYTTALKDKPSKEHPFRKAYIDAFAGTGYRDARREDQAGGSSQGSLVFPDLAEEATQELLDGSVRLALKTKPRFDRYVFSERSAERCAQLESLKSEFPELAKDVQIRQGDANTEIQELCDKDWRSHRAVLFLDPYGMQVEWKTIEAIAATKSIDLWVLFPLGIGVNRLLTRSGDIPESWRRRLNLLLGTETWYDEFYRVERERTLFGEADQVVKATTETIGRYFNERLRTVFAAVADEPRVLRNSANCPLYLLCFAAGNAKGAPIALRIANHLLTKGAR